MLSLGSNNDREAMRVCTREFMSLLRLSSFLDFEDAFRWSRRRSSSDDSLIEDFWLGLDEDTVVAARYGLFAGAC